MLRSGDVLHGRYRVERILGQGGMGGVYLATHLELEVPVAVKEMVFRIPDPEEHAQAVRQFKTEAQMLYRLHHANLPRVYDFFEDDGSHFLVMDYIDGFTYEEQVRVRGPLGEDEVRKVARELIEVLSYMHSQKPPVIFRDLKPANVMRDRNGTLKLIDFGIAKLFEDARHQTHTIIRSAGTPGFAAPEQYGAGTDERSDVYSLGATLYCLLTGQVPPPSPALAVDAAQLTPLEDLRPDLSSSLLVSVSKMMEANPSRRPRTMREVDALLSGSVLSTPPFPPPTRPMQPMLPPLLGFRLSGDTQELSDSGIFGKAPPRISGMVGTDTEGAPLWSRQADAVLETALFHRKEALDSDGQPDTDRRPAPRRDAAPADAPTGERYPLPLEVTVPVLIGVVTAIVFLVMLAAFLRAHRNAPAVPASPAAALTRSTGQLLKQDGLHRCELVEHLGVLGPVLDGDALPHPQPAGIA